MIWFFLCGMIAGAAGMVMVATWWMKKHIRRVSYDEMMEDLKQVEKEEESDNDGAGV